MAGDGATDRAVRGPATKEQPEAIRAIVWLDSLCLQHRVVEHAGPLWKEPEVIRASVWLDGLCLLHGLFTHVSSSMRAQLW